MIQIKLFHSAIWQTMSCSDSVKNELTVSKLTIQRYSSPVSAGLPVVTPPMAVVAACRGLRVRDCTGQLLPLTRPGDNNIKEHTFFVSNYF